MMIALTPTICANQDLIQAMAKRNPEEFQIVLKKLLPLNFQIDLTNDFDETLSHFCNTSKEEKQENGKCEISNRKSSIFCLLIHNYTLNYII